MLSLLLNLLGIHASAARRLTRVEFSFHGAIGVVWLILTVILLLAAVLYFYGRSTSHLSRPRRYLLAGLRCVLLLLLLLILARPIVRFTVEGVNRRVLPILIDTSASMSHADPRTDEADLKRAAIALNLLDPSKGLDQPLPAGLAATVKGATRNRLVEAVLINDRLKLIDRLSNDYDVRPFALPGGGRSSDRGALRPLPAGALSAKIPADGAHTPIGDALRELLARTRGQPLAGIVLITDGQSNSGIPVELAAEQAADEGVPIYAYGVGISKPKDIIVPSLFAPEVCFVNDEVSVAVKVRNTGLSGQPAHLTLKAGDEEVDHADLSLDADGEQVVQLKYKPDKAGEYDLVARIEPRPDEASKDNNEARQHVKVIDKKIKVLVIEQPPRWEFKYLLALLLRDPLVQAKCLLLEADPGVEGGEDSPYIKSFPAAREELIKSYDLIILGDVDPKNLTADQINNLHDFVSDFGGGLLDIAGRSFNPWAFAGSKIESLLPVQLSEGPPGASRIVEAPAGAANQPIHLELTRAGRESAMMRLAATPEASAKIWPELPPIWWDARVARAKPGAEGSVLMVDPDRAKASRFGPMPVIALQQVGLGQVLYVGTDNTWRWRKNAGDRAYAAFWGQAVRRLSLAHLLGAENKKTQISLEKSQYVVGDRVIVYARLYDDAFQPLTKPEVKSFVSHDGAHEPSAASNVEPPATVLLRPEPGASGIYRGEFIASAAGKFTFGVESDPAAAKPFVVIEPAAEQEETAMNEAALRGLANATKGAFFREEDLSKLPDTIALKSEKTASTYEVEIWSSWLFFLTILAVATAEWVLRKVWQLR